MNKKIDFCNFENDIIRSRSRLFFPPSHEKKEVVEDEWMKERLAYLKRNEKNIAKEKKTSRAKRLLQKMCSFVTTRHNTYMRRKNNPRTSIRKEKS